MTEQITFSSLDLSQPVQEAVRELGFEEPTPVQAQAIPVGCEGRDVLAAAQTGTGKTVAFLLPIFDRMVRHWGSKRPKGNKGPYALILTPTRELANQIADCAKVIAKHTDFRVMSVIGGVKYEKQIKGLERGCDILIATPGRLQDLVNQGACHLDKVCYLVLDEVDRMVDMGFWPSVHALCREVTGPHQTFLFSATFTPALEAKTGLLVNDPVRIEISHKGDTAETVEEFLIPVSWNQKQSLLVALLKEQGCERVLVFTPTKIEADACSRRLEAEGIKTDSIHSDKNQGKRNKALRDFREGKIDVLVATDVLARGIDINEVRYVVNYTVPTSPEDYVHRIGRTGRAGEAGRAYTFMSPDQLLDLREIEYFTKKLLKNHDVEGFEFDDARLVPDPKRPTKKAARRGRRPLRIGRR
ncbi:MAG: DEAD/DEAH box helicase [Coriobacteriia bacterium]|nr:DEAD/DEAH box helicase [Coriobacteriia bacterium]